MRRAILFLAVVGLLAVPVIPAGADNSWGSYHWSRSENPFTLNLVDNMTADWDGFLGSVSGDWTHSSVLDTPISTGDDSQPARKKCQAAEGAVRVCNAEYGFNLWLGIAEIWVKGDHIQKARARVNDSYLVVYTDEAKRQVLCQEVGHTLGLDHQDANSCMNDTNDLNASPYVSPNNHDYDQLETIYKSHVDGAGGGGGGGNGNGPPGGSPPGQGNGGNSGNVSVLVSRDGKFTKITIIVWAPGR